MANYCKVLILATSNGVGFTDQGGSAGLLTTNILRQLGNEPTLCKATLPVSDVPVLTRWINIVKACPRLNPVQSKVFIMSSPENYDTIVNWAKDKRLSDGGFPVENILCNEVPGSSSCAVADGVAGYLQGTGPPDATLVVIEADYLPEPEFGLSRIIEHTMVRAKDCVTFAHMNSTIPMVPRCAMALEGPDQSPKVTRIDPLGEPMEGDTMLGPVTVLRKDSVAEIAAFAEESLPAQRQLGEFLEKRVSAEGLPPVYGLNLGECFSIETMESYLFVHHFFEWYRQQKDGLALEKLKVEDGKIFLSEDTKLGGDIMAKTDTKLETIETLNKPGTMPWSTRLELGPMLQAFKDIYERRQAEAKLKPERELPSRFANASTWNYSTLKAEHPCFSTSNHVYGSKVPTQPQLVNNFFGSNGKFTKTFNSNNFKNDSLNCGKSRSKVHGELDEF